jgi:rhodanese-related sulfurtransferase
MAKTSCTKAYWGWRYWPSFDAFVTRLVERLRKGDVLEVADLKQRLDSDGNLLVLGVRLPTDYIGEQGHIAGSRNIPVDRVGVPPTELEDDLGCPIAIICRPDRRAARPKRAAARSRSV